MEIVGGAVQSLIPLLVLAAIIAAIVAWRRREGLESDMEEHRAGLIKRLYFYFATFIYMMVAGVGVVLIARYVLDELFGPPRLDRDVTQLALGVVLALIWTPVWAWHRSRMLALIEDDAAEGRSVLRKAALYLTLFVTAALTVQASFQFLQWVFDARSFGGYAPAALVVWGSLWGLTWAAERREGQPTNDTKTVRRLYVYATATYGLGVLASGAAIVIYVIFREAYEGLIDLPVILQGEEPLWGDTMKNALAAAVVGAGAWGLHWFGFAREDNASDLRQFYLYTLAIMGGVVTTLSATGVLLFSLLQWWVGTPGEDSASAHFRFLPGALAPLLVGLLLWAYHWTVVQQERAAFGQLIVARRVYRYIMTALGIGALAAAIVTLVPTVVAIIVTSAQEVLIGPDWWRDRIVLVLTLAILSVPVWGYHWYQAQRNAAEFGGEERYSTARRALTFGVVGIATLAALGSVSHILFLLLNASLEGDISLTLLRDAKWSMGAFAAAMFIGPYYWLIIRQDWETAPPAPKAAEAKAVTLLIREEGQALVKQLENALGVRVRVLQRADLDETPPALTPEDIEQLRRRVTEAPGGRVLIVADTSGVNVYSYR